MPFGAHETMDAHEILSAKINMIDHFAFYAGQCQDSELRGMLDRHTRTAVDAYNALLSYTHNYHAAQVNMPRMQHMSPDQIKYGLRNPGNESPQLGGQSFSDKQIAGAMLNFHKCSAKEHIAAALECADPYVREYMTTGAVICANAAYEVFNFMNQKGWYQVPTIDSHTAKTMLHHYKPAQHGMMPQGHMNPMMQQQGQMNQMNQNQMMQMQQGIRDIMMMGQPGDPMPQNWNMNPQNFGQQ